jgi:phosphotransferase family enzyme
VSQDPLTAFVTRSLHAEVSEVRSEIVAKNALMEVERIRFTQDGVERSLALKRVPSNDSLEVQLLPFLARKTDRVPRVLSRGVPPAAVPAWPWVMTEDLLDTTSACHEEPRAIVLTKVAIERAVATDGPALRALGVTTLTPTELVERAVERAPTDRPLDAEARAAATVLSHLPTVLCHGELACTHARITARGVVIVEWRRAYLGCGLLDVAQLSDDVRLFSGEDPGDKLFGYYGELTGNTVSKDMIRAGRLISQVTRIVSTDQNPGRRPIE